MDTVWTTSEAFVRGFLGRQEAAFREWALGALADWCALGIVTPGLFPVLTGLQKPSWGTWNGLLQGLKSTRRSILQGASPELRDKVQRSPRLESVLSFLARRVDPELLQSLEPLAGLCRIPLHPGARVGQVLTLPIALRNRITHEAPESKEWWDSAAEVLRPLARFLETAQPPGWDRFPDDGLHPWILEAEGQRYGFNGLGRNFVGTYLSRTGRSLVSEEGGRDIVLALQRLMGREEVQDQDFRRLLGRLAPEEIRGVLLGDFLVGRPVGEGGFARVHVGRQLSTGRKVAVKILRDGFSPADRPRFREEAGFLSRFDHPNIVQVLAVGEAPWTAPRDFSLSAEPWFPEFARGAQVRTYMVLEWIEGETLDADVPIGVPGVSEECGALVDAATERGVRGRFSTDGGWAAMATTAGQVECWAPGGTEPFASRAATGTRELIILREHLVVLAKDAVKAWRVDPKMPAGVAEDADVLVAGGATALGEDRDGILVATEGGTLLTFGPDLHPRESFQGKPGVTALHVTEAGGILLGFRDGSVELLRREGGVLRQEQRFTATSPRLEVSALSEVSPGVLAAGFGDGLLEILDASDGARLDTLRLHGRVDRLERLSGRLVATTEVGDALSQSIAAYRTPWCALREQVAREVPVVLRRGRPERRAAAPSDLCSPNPHPSGGRAQDREPAVSPR